MNNIFSILLKKRFYFTAAAGNINIRLRYFQTLPISKHIHSIDESSTCLWLASYISGTSFTVVVQNLEIEETKVTNPNRPFRRRVVRVSDFSNCPLFVLILTIRIWSLLPEEYSIIINVL